jgi:hypothetical protein
MQFGSNIHDMFLHRKKMEKECSSLGNVRKLAFHNKLSGHTPPNHCIFGMDYCGLLPAAFSGKSK